MAPSSKSKNCDICTTIWPILTEICMALHIWPPDLNGCSKIIFFRNLMCQMAAILKNIKHIIIDFPNLGLTYNGGWCLAI